MVKTYVDYANKRPKTLFWLITTEKLNISAKNVRTASPKPGSTFDTLTKYSPQTILYVNHLMYSGTGFVKLTSSLLELNDKYTK